MENRIDDLFGMSPADAKEYIARFIGTLKLTEKKLAELAAEGHKWEGRVELARSRGAGDLAAEAEKEAERVRAEMAALEDEIAGLRGQIERMKQQLPGLAARERSVDPDLLEQELLIARGLLPGDEEKAATERALGELEKNAAADAALESLKAKLKPKNEDSL